MGITADELRLKGEVEQDALYMDFYRAFWINITMGFRDNAIRMLRQSAAIAEACEFTMERIFNLQDRTVKGYEEASLILDTFLSEN